MHPYNEINYSTSVIYHTTLMKAISVTRYKVHHEIYLSKCSFWQRLTMQSVKHIMHITQD